MSIRIALPKGRLLTETAALLEKAGWQLDGYDSSLRNYRIKCGKFPDVQIKVFQEKDIPVQVAIGNYDLGICGLDWIQELNSKQSAYAPVTIRDLGYGKGALYIAASRNGNIDTMEDIKNLDGTVRIASEYPNIAENFALEMRLKRFGIYPVWGAADAYPPDRATLALISGTPEAKEFTNGIKPLKNVLDYSAQLIANRQSWEQKDLSKVLATLENIRITPASKPASETKTAYSSNIIIRQDADTVRLALPDGHQQKHVVNVLNKAGINMTDYPSSSGNRRPGSSLEGVNITVIRPQDMPLQVANGNFDLAITGHDWVTDHKAAFPSSPIVELADLKFGWVKIVAVVCNDVKANNLYELKEICIQAETPLRVASEYTNLSDKYARDNQLGMYRIIPTWGATEAFLPEDADLLIENTETGGTIARHNLKIIDTLFESTAHFIGAQNSQYSRRKQACIDELVKIFTNAVAKG
ncbi:MAG: ATP phosphoribosyltransferase [Dehalococcoidales bacterium]|nr:ATP phosphoribosyltransferase [Dehalococcoidales bacterium]